MTWDVTAPAGSDALSAGDDKIRELKTDLQTALTAVDGVLGAEGIFPVNTGNPQYRYRGLKGTTAQRPVSGNYGLYLNTDRNILQRDNGSAWEDVGGFVTRPTGVTVTSGGVAIGPSLGALVSITGSSYQDVGAGGTLQSVTITTIGRPVVIGLIPTSSQSFIGAFHNISSVSQIQVFFGIDRGGAIVYEWLIQETFVATSGAVEYTFPPGSFSVIDPVAAGTYTYKLRAKGTADTHMTAEAQNIKMIAYEL